MNYIACANATAATANEANLFFYNINILIVT